MNPNLKIAIAFFVAGLAVSNFWGVIQYRAGYEKGVADVERLYNQTPQGFSLPGQYPVTPINPIKINNSKLNISNFTYDANS